MVWSYDNVWTREATLWRCSEYESCKIKMRTPRTGILIFIPLLPLEVGTNSNTREGGDCIQSDVCFPQLVVFCTTTSGGKHLPPIQLKHWK